MHPLWMRSTKPLLETLQASRGCANSPFLISIMGFPTNEKECREFIVRSPCIYSITYSYPIYMQVLNTPTAPPIRANGTNNTTPPANNKHPNKTGTAITNNRDAKILAAPQVRDSAKPIALNDNQQNRITTNNSNKLFSPFIFGGFHPFHSDMDTKLFKIFRMFLLLLQKLDSKNSSAHRHINTPLRNARPLLYN